MNNIIVDFFLYFLIATCAVTDISNGKIPNKLTYSMIVLGLILGAIIGGWSGLLNSLAGFGLGFGMMFFIYMWGGFGGGDVKLMAAVGALKGYPFVLYAAFYSAIVGGIVSLIVIIWKGRFLKSLGNVAKQFIAFLFPSSIHGAGLDPKESTKIPFGFCICVGTLWAMLENIFNYSVWNLLQRLI